MTTLTIAEISAGLSIGHTLKAFIEVNNVNSKIKRLTDIVHQIAVKKFPANINSRLKAYPSLFGLYLVLSIVSYGVIRWINPTLRHTLYITVVAIIIGEIVYVTGLDRYHINIQKATKFLEKK